MALNNDSIKRTFNNLLDQNPIEFTWGGDDYTGTRTTLRSGIRYSEYGYANGYEFSIMANYDDFESLPERGDLITLSETEYRIIDIDRDAFDCGFLINIGDKYS